LLKVIVHAANISDRNAVHLVLAGLATLFPRLRHLWVDAGYSGTGADWVRQTLGWTVEVVKRPRRWVWLPEGAEPPPMPTGFQVLKRRWVVERTFAWLGRYRRLSKDYEVLPASEEAWIYLATTNLLLRRLAR
jgi:transposase